MVTGKAGKIPTIIMSNKNKNLYLNVSAAEMMQSEVDSSYYAKADSCSEESSCNEKGTAQDAESHYKDIFELAINEGDTDTKYSCTGTIKVTGSGTMISDDSLKTGDVTIGLTGYDDESGSQTLDLAALKTAENEKTYDIKYSITGNGTKTIKAYVVLANQNDVQNYLAGKTLNIEIAAENVKCDVVQPGA